MGIHLLIQVDLLYVFYNKKIYARTSRYVYPCLNFTYHYIMVFTLYQYKFIDAEKVKFYFIFLRISNFSVFYKFIMYRDDIII
jgi:hypothetical protein